MLHIGTTYQFLPSWMRFSLVNPAGFIPCQNPPNCTCCLDICYSVRPLRMGNVDRVKAACFGGAKGQPSRLTPHERPSERAPLSLPEDLHTSVIYAQETAQVGPDGTPLQISCMNQAATNALISVARRDSRLEGGGGGRESRDAVNYVRHSDSPDFHPCAALHLRTISHVQ
jgi:hypothetical protein